MQKRWVWKQNRIFETRYSKTQGTRTTTEVPAAWGSGRVMISFEPQTPAFRTWNGRAAPSLKDTACILSDFTSNWILAASFENWNVRSIDPARTERLKSAVKPKCPAIP